MLVGSSLANKVGIPEEKIQEISTDNGNNYISTENNCTLSSSYNAESEKWINKIFN